MKHLQNFDTFVSISESLKVGETYTASMDSKIDDHMGGCEIRKDDTIEIVSLKDGHVDIKLRGDLYHEIPVAKIEHVISNQE